MTVEVIEAFAVHEIETVLLKGPAIATWLYDDPLERPYGDIDLLLPPHRFDAARVVLAKLGFKTDYVPTSAHERTYHDEAWVRGFVVVELHRTLSGAEAAPETVWRALTRHTEEIRVEGAPVPVLARCGRCLLVALHAAHHGADVNRPLADLARALDRAPHSAWREAAVLAEEVGATQAFAAGLRLLPHGAALAENVDLPTTTSVGVALHAASAPAMAHALEWVTGGPLSLRAKAAFVGRKIVPPPEFLRSAYPSASRGRVGLACAYVVRIGALGRRLPAALRALRRARRAARSAST